MNTLGKSKVYNTFISKSEINSYSTVKIHNFIMNLSSLHDCNMVRLKRQVQLSKINVQ